MPFYFSFFTTLFLILFIPSKSFCQSNHEVTASAFGTYFTQIDSLFLNVNEEVLLGSAISLFETSLGSWAWGEKQRVSYFNPEGGHVKTVEFAGRGPGEIVRGVDYYYNSANNKISILDASLLRIKIYDENFSFVKEFSLDKNRNTKHTSNSWGHYFTLNEMMFFYDAPAVSEYDTSGVKVKEWGDIPGVAKVQRPNENGGGITSDHAGNVYYSYQGDYRVWKINFKKDSIVIFNDEPSYFREVDSQKLGKTRKAMELFYLGYEGTRVTNLFFLEPNIIIQQMETGNPFAKPPQELSYYLEIWKTNGEKLASGVEIPFPIAWTMGGRLAIPTQYPSKMIQKNGKIKAFNIFRFIKN